MHVCKDCRQQHISLLCTRGTAARELPGSYHTVFKTIGHVTLPPKGTCINVLGCSSFRHARLLNV